MKLKMIKNTEIVYTISVFVIIFLSIYLRVCISHFSWLSSTLTSSRERDLWSN